MRLTQAKYDQHLEDCDGYCLECEAVTAEDVEPEEMQERCPECDGPVYGMESALMYEYVHIGDADDDDSDVGIISLSDDED